MNPPPPMFPAADHVTAWQGNRHRRPQRVGTLFHDVDADGGDAISWSNHQSHTRDDVIAQRG